MLLFAITPLAVTALVAWVWLKDKKRDSGKVGENLAVVFVVAWVCMLVGFQMGAAREREEVRDYLLMDCENRGDYWACPKKVYGPADFL